MRIQELKDVFRRRVPGVTSAYRVVRKGSSSLIVVSKKLYFKYLHSDPQKLMINIGGARFVEKGWSVLDFQCEWYRHNTVFIDFWYDLTSCKRMPFGDNSVYLFYSEHTFEHISDEPCQYAFSEIHRCLKPGGGFRIIVPDMDLAYEKYGAQDTAFFDYWMKADNSTFTEAFLILFAHPRGKVIEDEVRYNYEHSEKEEFFEYYSKPLGQDPKRAGQHINWFNFRKLKKMLGKAGFQEEEIYESSAQMSRFKEMQGDQLDTRPWWSLHVEAIK